MFHPRALFCLFALFLFSATGYSQTAIQVAGTGYDGPVLRVDRSDLNAVDLTLSVGTLNAAELETKGGAFSLMALGDHGFTTDLGRPRLPVVREFIEIPRGASYELALLETVFVEHRLIDLGLAHPIAPAQAPVPKVEGAREAAPFLMDAAAYATDGWMLGVSARIADEVVLRGRRLLVLEIFPVNYNPAAGAIRVLTAASVRIDLYNADAGATAAAVRGMSSPHFDRVVQSVVLNAEAFETPLVAGQPTRSRAVNYLMIAAPDYMTNAKLQDLISLRTSQGYSVTLVSTNTTGTTTTAIKSYIQNAYNTQGTDSFLLIGDTNTIPKWTGSGSGSPDTDLNYACVDGSDYIPDLGRGRFPVRTATQLNSLCDKIIANGSNLLKKAVFMASEDNWSVSEGTHNYVISNYLNPDGWTYDKLYCHTYNATTSQVTNAFNNGRSIGCYSGHGDVTYWADGPYFSQSNVTSLTNTIYPFVMSFACLTGSYNSTECFAETWVRDDHGATAMFASSTYSYWDEDDILEKRMFKGYQQQGYDRIGDIIDYGQYELFLWMGSGSFARGYYEQYNLMGEPTMYVLGGGGGGGGDDPVPDIKVNGSDSPGSIHVTDWATATISLDPGDHDGEDADWWVYVEKDGDTWWRKYSGSWVKSAAPIRFVGATLRTVNNYVVLGPRTLPAGIYGFFFDVDEKNGIHEGTHSDSCTLLVYN